MELDNTMPLFSFSTVASRYGLQNCLDVLIEKSLNKEGIKKNSTAIH